MIRLWLCGVAVSIAVAIGGGVAQAAVASGCRVTSGSTTCLSHLFRNNGTEFNASVWAQDLSVAQGNASPALLARYRRLFAKALTSKEKRAILARYNRVAHITAKSLYGTFPPISQALAMCRRLLQAAGYRYDKSACEDWYASGFDIITSWQYSGPGSNAGIAVYGFNPNHMNQPQEIAELQFPGSVPGVENAAWRVVDSPLPLIAWFKAERSVRYEPSASQSSLAGKEWPSAAQFLGFWGYGYTPVLFSPEVRRAMKAAGFNPLMAGGPNVPPGRSWPSWTTRSMATLRVAGWRYDWPEAALDVGGLPQLAGHG